MTSAHDPPSGEQTRIIRRHPTTPADAGDTRTGIIHRAPSAPRGEPPADDAATGVAKTAVAGCVVAMLSGWATSVIATDLITGWWDTDRLFCLAVGFLALVFAVSTTAGIVLVLLQRSAGRWLIAAGAVVALLAYGGVFIAGARLPWVVYLIPVLPVASAVLALHPSTRRWTGRP